MLPLKSSSLVLTSLFLSACSGFRPDDIGIMDNALTPCPSSPNCVISQAGDEDHAIAPLKLKSGLAADEVIQSINDALKKLPRIEVITQTDVYVYAEATTKIMRFVDDVEFLIDTASNVIHVRSASRLGYRDFDANRDRVEAIRALLEESGTVIQ